MLLVSSGNDDLVIFGLVSATDEQTGLGARHAFTLSLAQFSLGLLGVLTSWLLLSYLGRRTTYLSGQALTFLCVLLIGILACIPHVHPICLEAWVA